MKKQKHRQNRNLTKR